MTEDKVVQVLTRTTEKQHVRVRHRTQSRTSTTENWKYGTAMNEPFKVKLVRYTAAVLQRISKEQGRTSRPELK